ncbi:facilitated trehalose transporter Tret1-like [Danaus plexippus]|uniref:facilitated trehalose transporter Tret1-like n=1 Tax=Danaus plexippus TaxID=13037 RepID=UPI000239E502|nr:facilitated trehalose transporter Tret1-like [Danaus plexippus]
MKLVLSASLIRQYVIVTIVNLGSLTTGMSMYWTSPMIVKLSNGTDIPLPKPITEREGSWIVSGGYLAAIGTNFLGGLLIDKIGRKYCIILVTVPRICASVWTIFANEVWMLILCRAVMVLTDCYMFVAIPVYVSEIASKDHRGPLGAFLHISSCTGIVITLGVGPFLSYAVFNAILAGVIVITALPLPFLPDSPFYLYTKGRIDDSLTVLSKIRASDDVIKQEIEDYKSAKRVQINTLALFRDKIFLKSLSLGILICVGSNAIGYNAVSFYLQTILDSTKTSVQSEHASVVIGCIQLFAALCTSFFNNTFGRRPILIYTLAGLFLGMIGLGTFFEITTKENYVVTGFLNYLPIISLIVCTYCFNVGIGCLIFVVTAELFEGAARAIGVSICILVSLLIVFLTTNYFSEMALKLGPSNTYWFFSAMCALVCTLIYFFIPETKGKTFSEIQTALGRKNNETEDKERQTC